ncbi:HAD-IC family P-type ATPase [Cyanobium sp. NIES-981]|uniref:cation-translocating P-type ATPase n=1 Tax=Cyanobium sp. NIES-981 TaxID=1851505 RepID=UPI0007DCEE6F|nr:HAD-IC family P-type ATPase [Cyanobium sp. NIES-981]SBO41981.1 putative cation-transporting ATPase F [Cyanobium sp. NIES-981]
MVEARAHEAPNPWHALPIAAIPTALATGREGLTTSESQRRLERQGPNALPRAQPPSGWAILRRQFRSPLIAILAVAAVVSLAIGDLKDGLFIAAVLLINGVVGGLQEWQAERQSQALQQLLRMRATVIRGGVALDIDAEELVPGDLVSLESGQRVPADLRLIGSSQLELDESLLTGESLTVLKSADWSGAADTPLAERLNMLFAGSTVVRGRGQGFAVATGPRTEVGRLALAVLGAAGGRPPLLRRMERFSRVIAIAVLVAASGIGLLGALHHGYGPMEMFLFAVALAVSAIPEGLPVALTVALAVATRRMARRQVIVRQLPAVEGLGSCTLIACDKTGTLTCNELTVRRIVLPDGESFEVSGEGFHPAGQVLREGRSFSGEHPPLARLARTAALCNEADLRRAEEDRWIWRGDPTDIALLALAHKLGWSREHGLERHPQLHRIPFEPERQYAASFHPIEGEDHVLVKGAPERVLAMCKPVPGRPSPHALARQMAERGYRVLALAEGPAPLAPPAEGPHPAGFEPTWLNLLGFVGMIDPLRPGVRQAIATCHRAGITVWMVTGDHPVTALAIARDLGLAPAGPGAVVTGRQLDAASPETLRGMIRGSCVYARMAPEQKLRLVNAARAAGHCVAVTGDGVNDAPALRAANIGVAMGRGGTDVAREAAELVIADDNFATIVAGVEEGRIAYANVRKVIYLLVSTGAAEIVLITLAVALRLPLPLLPVQLLWLNLVTNGIQDLALAFEPGEGDALSQRPRPPSEPVFNGLMIQRTLLAAAVMGGVGFATYDTLLRSGAPLAEARNALLLLMVLFENVHLGNCRSETRSVLQLSPLRSPVLLAGTVTAFLLHVLMMHIPFGQLMLDTEPVAPALWLRLVGLSLTVLLVIEADKGVRRLAAAWRRRRQRVPEAG